MIISNENWERAVQALMNNEIIAYPTDTVYGLAVRLSDEKTKNLLMERKKRPSEKALPIMVADIEMLKNIAQVDARAIRIIEAYMPGPLTIILKKQEHIEKWVNDGRETLAIRFACDNIIKNIIKHVGSPIFLTSANLSDHPVLTSVSEIEKANLADLIIDGHPKNMRASTIVDLSQKDIKILREGPLSLEDIKKVVG